MENQKQTTGYRVFTVVNTLIMIALLLICFLPIWYVLCVSLSDNVAVSAGRVSIWPVNFTTMAYEYLIAEEDFWLSMWVACKRVFLGCAVNMFMLILTAYPLSQHPSRFPARKRYAWYFVFTMLFSGGLIPGFLVVRYTGLMNSLWALIIPGALPIYNMILMLNFFRQLPYEVSESAFIDGASHWTTLWRIVVPMSKPAIATVLLFCAVGHWNEWFSPIIYMKRPENYPLQTYLHTKLISASFQVNTLGDLDLLNKLSNRTVNSAQIFIGMVPILCVYPFLQKYFTKGIVLGSVKG